MMNLNFTLTRVMQALSGSWWATEAGRAMKAANDAQVQQYGADPALWSNEAKAAFMTTVAGIDY